ncbi:putative pentatricopeptide repeat-containing protein At5g59200, chloroplastic [Magnolia sinica]|uniref:putative pentatricopeptide repeat-containing protein At5g59200, chloroplastic n=1 Tax=Magnolia sinica TaxID=86752 RepID=UPI0026584370|nr:putative pentatricopeptide repeat-containing protein At5g59200, chloroplastic [Magnolia sinica]
MPSIAFSKHPQLLPIPRNNNNNISYCKNNTSDSNNNKNHIPLSTRQLENHAFSLLQSCNSFAHLTQIHAHIIRHSIYHNNFVATKLVSSYFSSHNPSYALCVFEEMPHPNTFLWNAVIKGLVNLNSHQEALIFYSRMLARGSEPDRLTFPFTLKACSKLLAAEEGEALHGQILKLGFGSDVYTQTSLLDFYGSCNDISAACHVFNRMPERDVVSWNAIVACCVRCGLMELGKELFEEMPVKNVSSWTTMIGGFVHIGSTREALALFHRMQMDGVKPDKMTIVTVLSAVADLGMLDFGKWVHDYVKKNEIEINAFVGTALIDMYAKCGSIQEARIVFDGISLKTISCYNAMIMGLAIHALGEEAISVFREAERMGIGIDNVTMIAILSACRHSGLVEEGVRFFNSMKEGFGIEAKMEHYRCMVDLLGRAGWFDEAMEMVESIEADSIALGTLAFACQIHGNVGLGEKLMSTISMLDPSDCGLLVLKSKLYAADGKWEEAAKVRRLMKDRGNEKKPGSSWIEVNNVIHEFVAGDDSHPYSKEIYSKLAELSEQMKLPAPMKPK